MNMHVDMTANARSIQRRNTTVRALNLALQGAGAHGAFGWGILDKLLEDSRVDIDGLLATGAGAMNAVVYAYGDMKGGREQARVLLETFWRKASENGAWGNSVRRTPFERIFDTAESMSWRWFEGITQVLSPYEFNPFNLNPMRDILETVIDFDEFYRRKTTRVAICATHVRSGKPRTFSGNQITVDAVLASACMPTLSQAVEIDGEHYWDGVYSGYPELTPLLAKGATRDILIGQISPVERCNIPRRAPEIQNRISEITLHASLLREIRAIAAVTQMIDDDWIKPEHRAKLLPIHVHAIHSGATMSDMSLASKFDTSWRALTKLRDKGRQAAELWLETNFDKIGVRSTIDLHANHL
jgi:NTE family protein